MTDCTKKGPLYCSICDAKDQRISELETELYEEKAAGRAARLTIVDDLNQVQRKYDALVIKVQAVLEQHHFGETVPKALIRSALLENDDD